MFQVGDVIRKVRDGRGLTLEQLAQKSGVNKGTISEIERGTANPRLSTLHAIAEGLGTTIEALFSHTQRAVAVAEDEPASARDSAEAAELAALVEALDPDDREWIKQTIARFSKSPDGAASQTETPARDRPATDLPPAALDRTARGRR